MFRRLSVLVLALACAFAPALAALTTPAGNHTDCCCAKQCCASADCAAPAPARAMPRTATALTVEARASTPRPVARFVRLILLSETFFRLVAPGVFNMPPPIALAHAASAPLFKEHCSFLI